MRPSFASDPRGVIVDQAILTEHPEIVDETPVAVLASPEDLAQVTRNPLIRARLTLKQILESTDISEREEIASALIMLAYVQLAFRNFDEVLDLSKKVLDSKPPPGNDEVLWRAHDRRKASARMYAAEASCELGQVMDAIKYLAGDGKEDAFDRLASDLCGVTLKLAASDGKAKRRLARAQATVRASASCITADLGNLAVAKQLADSARSLEDPGASGQESLSARRALVYVLLKNGQHGQALSQLRTIR
jgi:tetratricopeptide (TPR) repeat protein